MSSETMRSEHFQAVAALFEAVRGLPPETREERLARAEPAVRTEVLELLAHHDADDELLGSPDVPVQGMTIRGLSA